MKKFATVLSLVLLMLSSVVAGTLAVYTTSIDELAKGDVTAKEFIFVGEGTESFGQGIKIAPSETVKWHFKVKNFENHIITETDLYYKLSFHVAAMQGKQAIQPLVVRATDSTGKVLGTLTGTGSFDVLGSFPLSEMGQEKDFYVEIIWPSDGSSDINYAGGGFGSTIRVDAAASQIPFEETQPPQNSKVSVLYETTAPWQNGGGGASQYQYQVTITNHSDKPIRQWNIAFSLPTDRLSSSLWRARADHGGLPQGSYRFLYPNYNNEQTDNILPGQSVTFGGHATGTGTEPISGVLVGGSDLTPGSVNLTYRFGVPSLN